MSDADNPQIDPKTGLEFFIALGQKRYMCPTFWESGARCQRDHYDPQWILDHAREPHTATGLPNVKPATQKRVSSLIDTRGNQMEYEVPEDLKQIHFKK